MEGLDRAQRNYDRQEPDWVDDEDEPLFTDASQLSQSDIDDFLCRYYEAGTDHGSLTAALVQQWYDGETEFTYSVNHAFMKWARQAAFEAQLPPPLKRQASIN